MMHVQITPDDIARCHQMRSGQVLISTHVAQTRLAFNTNSIEHVAFGV